MKLKQGGKYVIQESPEQTCDECYILRLMEKGFMVGEPFTVVHHLKSISIIELQDGQKWAIRDEELLNCNLVKHVVK